MENQQNSINEKRKRQLTLLVVAMLICILACIIVAASMFGFTFSKYANDAVKGNEGGIAIAKWGVTTTVESSLKLEENEDVVEGKIAPGSTGYIDVKIECDGTEVSVDYTITIGKLSIESGELPSNLKIKEVKASKDGGSSFVEPALTKTESNESDGSGKYSGTIELEEGAMTYKDTSAFIVRIYVEWEDGDTAQNNTGTGSGDPKGHVVRFHRSVYAYGG